VVLVTVSADAAGGAPAGEAVSALKAALEHVAKLDPLLAETISRAKVQADPVNPGRVSAELSFSNTAMERLAERLVEALAGPR
jgi:hypothetical protein